MAPALQPGSRAASAAATLRDPRWEPLERRDPSADGRFFYGVRTTGVACRPSCPSRRPSPENVEFFDRLEDAVRAGYRPCKRCKPDGIDPRAARSREAVRACRLLEDDDGPRRSADVARALGLSPHYFQRWFLREVGVTPQAYRRRVLAERAKEALPGARSVTGAAALAGYGTTARFYDGPARELGMRARDARFGARGAEVRYALRRSSLGRVLVAWTERGVCHVAIGDTDADVTAELQERFPEASLARSEIPAWVDAVIDVVERPRATRVPIDVQGTAFQERVWSALRGIAPGDTRSYSEVAASLGAPRSARAVANACASNRLAILVPCHRVVREDGAAGGYRWGVSRKETLLAREASNGRAARRARA
jgi:AraC family transcriptional regulator of adaptative response/methylated-DNA-[protein]-cysteine methyltransferase